MDARFKVLVVSENQKVSQQLINHLEKKYNCETCTSYLEASDIIFHEQGKVGAVFFHLNFENSADTSEIIKSLRTHFHPEIILCLDSNISVKKDFPTITKIMKQDVKFNIVLPSFAEQTLLYAKEAIAEYRSRKIVIPDNTKESHEFQNWLQDKREKGIPMTEQELKMWMSYIQEASPESIDELLEKLHKPSAEELRNITVLIIEDEEDRRNRYVKNLKRPGYNIITAKSKSEALKYIQSTQKIDVILLDLVLEDGSGEDLFPEIKKHKAHTPIIVITAYGTVDALTKCINQGAFDFIAKSQIKSGLIAQKVLTAIHKSSLEKAVLNMYHKQKAMS